MKKIYRPIVFIVLVLSNGLLYGQSNSTSSIAAHFKNSPSLKGKPAFLGTPFNTAGDKLYMIGHQDGSFPNLGWHVKDEMGGIWHHPIKLMDGFNARITIGTKTYILDKATQFVNFPLVINIIIRWDQHRYKLNGISLFQTNYQGYKWNMQLRTPAIKPSVSNLNLKRFLI